MFDVVVERLGADSASPWDAGWDLVPVGLVDEVVRGERRGSVTEMLADPDCPVAPELLSASAF
jgi:hypothetical protein